jgi:uncharacterized protein YbjT (DUF2867 family)
MSIFITGATGPSLSPSYSHFTYTPPGYIGGSILSRLLSHPSFSITALVRSPEKAAKLEGLGITCVLADLGELEKVEAATEGADYVFSTVSVC